MLSTKPRPRIMTDNAGAETCPAVSPQAKEPKAKKGELAPHSARDVALADRLQARRRAKPPLSQMTVEMNCGGATLSYKHSDQALAAMRLMDVLATGDASFSLGILGQLANIASLGNEVVGKELDFALAIVKAVDPKDELEALLATQMAAVHISTMAMARRLRNAELIETRDSASGAFNKLARTFTTQIEALKKHRANGEQTVRVEHVHVHAGGQAVVGNLGTGGVAKSKATP